MNRTERLIIPNHISYLCKFIIFVQEMDEYFEESNRNYFFHYRKQFQELLQKIVIMKGFFQLCSHNNNVGHLNSDPYWPHLSPVCTLTYIRVCSEKNVPRIHYLELGGAGGWGSHDRPGPPPKNQIKKSYYREHTQPLKKFSFSVFTIQKKYFSK